MQHQLTTSGTPRLSVELRSGDLLVTAGPEGQVTVDVSGTDAEDVTVEQRDDEVRVVARRRAGFLGIGGDLRVVAAVPVGSQLVSHLGSANVRSTAPLGQAEIATGSGSVTLGEVTGAVSVKSGSGSVDIAHAGGDVDVKTGSGDVSIGEALGTTRVGTGSGRITVTRAGGATNLKSGSGDLTVADALGATSLSAASGDLRIGRMGRGQAALQNVSGDIRLGIPRGTPVWTDLSTRTGNVRSSLEALGPPASGQDHVEVRARTVTGDIHLEQLTKEQP